jgi:hypothetical protein
VAAIKTNHQFRVPKTERNGRYNVNSHKTSYLTVIATVLLIGANAAVGSTASAAPVAATLPSGSGRIATTSCQPGAGTWTDCAVMLSQSVPAGAEVAASVPSSDGTVAFCEQSASPDAEGDNTVAPAGTVCGLSGNTANFTCVDGCAAGTDLDFSLLNGSGTSSDGALAQQITVTGGSAAPQTALPAAVGS